MAQKNTADKKLGVLEEQLSRRKADQQDILLERIRDREHADVYTQMLERCEADIERIAGEISSIRHYDSTIKKRKAEMKRSVELIDQIIAEGAVSDANLRLLVDEILIQEQNGQLHVTITLNAEFRRHMDFYDENGELTDRAFAV